MQKIQSKKINIREKDLTAEDAVRIIASDDVAIDTESTGFDFYSDTIQLIQFGIEDEVWVVKEPDENSINIVKVFQSDCYKYFHYAKHDLTFLFRQVLMDNRVYSVSNIRCTKILAKMYSEENCSLGPLVLKHLGIEMNKKQVDSAKIGEDKYNWLNLTDKQLEYAVGDVLYLKELYDRLYSTVANCFLLRFGIIDGIMDGISSRAFMKAMDFSEGLYDY